MTLTMPALAAVFVAAGAATWIAGIWLSRTTEALDDRLHLGSALGGTVLLAVAGSLPEIAITVSAVIQGHLDVAAGNLIGGIAIQTAVLILCDAAVSDVHPLTYLVGSLLPVLEGSLVILVVGVMLLGTLLPPSVAIAGVSPASIGIVVVWLAGIGVLNRVRNEEPWTVTMPGSRPGRKHRHIPHPERPVPYASAGLGRVVAIFAVASAVILVAGAVLQTSGDAIADAAGINGLVFGATFLAAASALPEISTGIEAVRLGDHQLAMGDIFGGNAFQLCIFLLADLLAGRPVLPEAGIGNAWLGTLGIIMTMVYAAAVVIRPQRRILRLGIDSLLVGGLLIMGLVGLQAIAG